MSEIELYVDFMSHRQLSFNGTFNMRMRISYADDLK